MINVVIRNSKNEPVSISVKNISISEDSAGVTVEVENPTYYFEYLQNNGFKVCTVGNLLNIDCRSIYCF